jgi:hypothetical protein
MRPVAAVELDDSSHARADRRARDEFVRDALSAAGLPLVSVKASRQYEPRALREAVLTALKQPNVGNAVGDVGEGETDTAEPVEHEGGPLCPKCRVPMVRRVAKRGEHHGQAFFGCPNYPRCRKTVQDDGGRA